MRKVVASFSSVSIKEYNLVIEIFSGIMTESNCKAFKLIQATLADYDRNHNRLADLTLVDKFEVKLDNVINAAKYIKDVTKTTGDKNVAIWINNPTQYKYAEAYSKKLEEISKQKIEVFYTIDESLDFVERTELKEKIIETINYYRENPMFHFDKRGNDIEIGLKERIKYFFKRLFKIDYIKK